MSHQSFPKATGSTTDGYVLTYSGTDGYWAPRPSVNVSTLSGWQSVYEVNFASLANQSFSGNGDVTIDGKTWTVENFAAATSFGIVNTEGLKFTCNTSNTDYNNGTRNSLLIKIPISNIYSNFDIEKHEVRMSFQITQNGDATFEHIFAGFEHATSPTSQNFSLGKGFNGGTIIAIKDTLNFSSTNAADATNSSDDSLIVEMNSINEFSSRSGTYSGGWPANTNLRRVKLFTTGGDIPFEKTSDINAFITTITVNTSGTFVATVHKFKVEVRVKGTGSAGVTGTAGGDLIGTYPNPTVSKIQGRAVDASTPSDGYVLTYVTADGYWAPRQGTVSRYTVADSNTIIHWKFDESGVPYSNSGSGAALNLTTFTGTPASVTGIFNKALGTAATTLTTGNTTVNEPTGTALTVSVWVRVRGYATFGTIVNKAYRNNNSWISPFVSIYLSLSNTGDGSWGPAITTGAGVLTQPVIGGAYRIMLGDWTLLSYTYDGSNLRSYINGALANTTAVTGAIDFGTHGPWDVGGVSNAGVGQFWDGHIDDLRIETVVRSQAYFEAMYKAGINLRD